MRKFIVVFTFSIITPIFFVFTLLYILFIKYNASPNLNPSNQQLQKKVAYAALPAMSNSLIDEVVTEEGRAEIIRQFLAKNKSPLEPYAGYIVDIADQYGLDFRLITAIAMQESNLCKRVPKESNNCWGWGIYGGKITKFNNYSEGIETVTRTLATKYKNKGLVTPEQIMTMYTPSSDGSWAYSVNHFMEKLQ